MRRYLGIAVGLLAAGCGTAHLATAHLATTPAHETTGVAASCANLSPAQQYAAAGLVFVGQMLVGHTERFAGRRVLVSPAKMRVARYLKGHGPNTVTVQTALSYSGRASVTVAEDGIDPQPGERWKIYASSDREPFATSICLGSVQVTSGAVTGGSGSGGGAPAGNPAAALRLWRSFPVDATPRPIVPLGEGLVLDPVSGFRTVDQKLAFLEARFALGTRLPAGPSTAGQFTLISAAAAYHRLRASGNSQHDNVPPLIVTRAQLGTASVVTDRGPAQRPVWQFSFQGVAGPASVLALKPPEVYLPPAPHRLAGPGPGGSIEDRAASSGTTITIWFPGLVPGNGPCDANYAASALADRRAVAFTITTSTPAPRAGVACPALAVLRHVRLHLARPLGARVLVSSIDGGAVEVSSAPAGPGVGPASH